MAPSDLLYAAMLLSAPMGTPEAPPTPERWPIVRDALHQTAVKWEILDPRETRYVLTKPEDFQDDLDFLRKRRADLAEAPRIVEAELLADRNTINDYIRFNRAFRKNMELRLAWESDRADFIREVIDENERLYKIWDAIRDAKSDMHYVTTRRFALLKLRDLIGPDAFAKGAVMPYVPDWRFARLP
jgi:hypothetical protein